MKQTFTLLFLLFATIAFAQNSQENMDWQWAKGFGGTSDQSIINNQPHHLAVDDYGNTYMFGIYGGGMQLNGENLPSFTDYNCGAFAAKFDCNGNIVWHKAIARVGQEECPAQYMVLKDNRIYLQGNVKVDQYYHTYFLDTTVSGSVLSNYYNHYPDSITFPWIPASKYTYLMELDLDGNIVDYNLFSLYKKDIEGNHTNIAHLSPSDKDKPVPFAIDNQHNYYLLSNMALTGLTDSLGNQIPQKMVFWRNGEGITDSILIDDNKYRFRLLKFDRDFNLQYTKPLALNISDANCGSLEMYFSDIATDMRDNIYISGYVTIRYARGVEPAVPIDLELADDNHIYFYNTEHLSAQEGVPEFCQSFVMKMNSDGEILWVNHSRNYGKASSCEFYSMLLDENTDNIYVSGLAVPALSTGSCTVLGENDTVINDYNGNLAILKGATNIIACYDTDGNYKWYNCPNALGCSIGSLATYNNKLYAGILWVEDLINENNVYYPSEQVSEGVHINGFAICEWDMQGNMANINQIYSTGQIGTAPYDTRINSLGEIYTAGRFENIIAFGEDTLFSSSYSDMFIAKFGLPCPTYIYDTATYCYGEVVQGVTLTASGDYTFVYPEGGQEIDSIVLVHATVLPPLTIGLSDTTVCTAQQFYLDACGEFDSYQWSTGGTGCTEMLQFDNACTQSVTLTVTRGECSASKTISITAQVCDGITEPSTTAMSLYPNPASDMVTIFGDGFVSATVIDLAGRTLLRTTAMQLDISGLRPGEYVVKVERINGETEELKMVKE